MPGSCRFSLLDCVKFLPISGSLISIESGGCGWIVVSTAFLASSSFRSASCSASLIQLIMSQTPDRPRKRTLAASSASKAASSSAWFRRSRSSSTRSASRRRSSASQLLESSSATTAPCSRVHRLRLSQTHLLSDWKPSSSSPPPSCLSPPLQPQLLAQESTDSDCHRLTCCLTGSLLLLLRLPAA